jgi:fructose-bisphosphate aldolase class II
VDCLAISYGTKHGAAKGVGAKLRKEIAIASMENLKHEGIFGVLVSHGSSTVPQYIVEEINELGGKISNAHGIDIRQLQEVIPHGIGKINVDTDIRLAVTRNMREYFVNHPSKKESVSVGSIWNLLEQKADQFDPRAFLPPIMETVMTGNISDEDVADIVNCIEKGVKEVVGALIVQFGSVGYASKIQAASLEEMAERYKKEVNR